MSLFVAFCDRQMDVSRVIPIYWRLADAKLILTRIGNSNPFCRKRNFPSNQESKKG
jgi:hypothetical protein